MEPNNTVPAAPSPLPPGNTAPGISHDPQIATPEKVALKPEAQDTSKKKIGQMENFAPSKTQAEAP